ncbi:MAG TPA: VCBS repeat-containing protein [Blastocatellia bacterium]|nr:VCBS repeat-containing protein [Blastocatellia bacterium]
MKNKLVLAVLGVLLIGGGWFLVNHRGGGLKVSELQVPHSGKAGFTLMPPAETGIAFANNLRDDQATANQLLNIGSGVAAGDYDGDGLCDLYFCSMSGRNVLYKNLGGWKFADVTDQAGVACSGKFCTGATFADLDGDGDLDLLVTAFGSFTAYMNDGAGRFTEVTSAAGLSSNLTGTTIALADIDGDGDLDLYVTHYRTTTLRDGEAVSLEQQNGQIVIPPKYQDRVTFVNGALKEFGEPDTLYRNDGTGHFTPLSWTDGTFLDEDGHALTRPPLDWGLAVTFRDINEDGYPDVYVCNDYWTPDRIWINDGKGHFRALDRLAMRNTSASSMGIDFADIDRDGHQDFFVVDMLSRDHQYRMRQTEAHKPAPRPIGKIDDRPQVNRNTLYLNRGDETFAEIANLSGVEASEWSWSPVFLDVDLDGYEDLLITNGHAHDVQDADTNLQIKSQKPGSIQEQQRTLLLYPPLITPKVAFRNLGNLRFEETGHAWGFDTRGIANGVTLADLDNDGDLDVITNNLGSPAGLYRNDSDAPRVAVRLLGEAPNTQAIGAKIKLLGGAVPEQTQEVICGGRYESGADPLRVFAAGLATGGMAIEVTWRSGARSRINDVLPNRLYEINESGSGAAPPPTPPEPLFKDVSNLINHAHHENEFDDFQRQPLLANRLSQLGPGVAWHDIDGDGNDDLIVGSGKDGRLAVFLNNGKGGFGGLTAMATAAATARDQTSVLAWTAAAGSSSLLAGLSNDEDGQPDGQAATRIDFANVKITAQSGINGRLSATGPLAMADIDGDGDLDLFVGGRSVPGKYPQPAVSQVYRNDGSGQFVLDEPNTAKLSSLGMVSGAVFSDIDGDGDPDLILALEWGPIMVFTNDGGNFTDAPERFGLAGYKGWWNGVTVGDLNEDGRLDIIATNWGLNSKYHADAQHPLRLYYADFDGNGTLDLVESYFDAAMGKYVPFRGLDAMAAAMPFLKDRFTTYKAYGAAGVEDLFGPKLTGTPFVTATTLESMAFMNRGDHFEAVPLPIEAQFAPGFGVNVADFDGDGHDDVFIAQNFFATQIDTPRLDGGRGLWLKGDGTGKLASVSGQQSSIKVYGDARGAALADFDRDGRVDLVVTQNGAATRLFKNVGARPGLRVRLAGAAGNPEGVGATIRLIFGNRQGPAREIHAGSGYWSQDSAVQVLGTPEAPTQVWVRWPGGKQTTANIPANAKEIRVAADGSVSVVQ